MEQHSQVAKSLRLRNLRERLQRLCLGPDVDHSMLQLLFSLANKPLHSSLHGRPGQPGPAAAAAAPPSPTSSAPGSGSAGREGDEEDGDDDRSLWSSDGELSDWGGDGGSEHAHAQPDQGPSSHATASSTSQPATAPAAQQGPNQQQLRDLSRQQLAQFDPPLVRCGGAPGGALQTCQPQDLVSRLTTLRLQGLSFAAPKPSLCYTDPQLVEQILSLLLGRSTTLFPWDTHAQCFVPTSGLHVPYLSPSMLHALLRDFAASGTVVFLLRQVAGSTRDELELAAGGGGARSSGSSSVRVTPCVRAFLQALGAQLHAATLAFVQLQHRHSNAASGAPQRSGPAPSLLHLHLLCLPAMRRVHSLATTLHLVLGALAGVCAGAAPTHLPPAGEASPLEQRATAGAGGAADVARGRGGGAGGGGAPHPACVSCAVLEELYRLVQGTDLQGGPQGQVERQLLLHLLLASLVPLLESLHAWLYEVEHYSLLCVRGGRQDV